VHLLNQGGIARKAFGIQIAHLIDQGLQLLARLGTILDYGTNLVEKVQSLVNLALGIGRVGSRLGSHGLPGDVGIAGVIGAIPVAIAIAAARVACGTGDAVADRTCQGSGALAAGLTGLTGLATLTGLALLASLALLTTLTGLAALLALLAGLTGLPVAGEWAGLAGLTLSRLTLSGLSVGTSAEAGELIAQAG